MKKKKNLPLAQTTQLLFGPTLHLVSSFAAGGGGGVALEVVVVEREGG
jgi:hypothetical protein